LLAHHRATPHWQQASGQKANAEKLNCIHLDFFSGLKNGLGAAANKLAPDKDAKQPFSHCRQYGSPPV
jgi:hypothetical protein